MPKIPANGEAEIRIITVQGQPGGKKNYQDPHLNKKAGCEGTHLSSQLVGSMNRRVSVQTGQGVNSRPISKIRKAKIAGGMTQVRVPAYQVRDLKSKPQ
jgi:hypothetical protein